MADRKPEFISLMRTIRDVYYKEMGETVEWMKQNSNIFWLYTQQMRRAEVSSVTNVQPIDDVTHGDAFVTVDTTSDQTKMQFTFGIPEGLKGEKGEQGVGVSIQGSDTYANIIAKTDALIGECWISKDTPAIDPPSGTAAPLDGLVPIVDNPADASDWVNVGPIRGEKGERGTDGINGTNGTDGREGEKWFVTSTRPSSAGDIPGAEIGDLALVSNVNPSINGEFYELFGNGWTKQGHLRGNTGETGVAGSAWHSGVGVPSDSLGVNTDMYVDTSNNDYYIKSGNTWGSPVGNLGGNAVPIGGIINYSGLLTDIPSGWNLCDGGNGTPNLTDRFVYGTITESQIGDTGGSKDSIVVSHSHTFTGSELPSHNHRVRYENGQSGGDNSNEFASGSNSTGSYESNLRIEAASAGTPSGAISTDGISGSNANLPPYIRLAYIMRIS